MFENDDSQLRVVLTAYWQDTAPSTEIVYMCCREPFLRTLACFADIEQRVFDLLQANSITTLLRVIYVTSQDVDLSMDDIAECGWRVLS